VTVAGQVQPRSLALAYGLGALCTGLTVTIASWWVSNLNIVAAMRGLPGGRRRSGMREALRRAWRALCLAGRALLRLQPVLAGRCRRCRGPSRRRDPVCGLLRDRAAEAARASPRYQAP
jgi:hypothetical protein